MAGYNPATTASKKVDEVFVKESLTETQLVDKSYDAEWNGNKTVTVYGVDVVEEGNYTMSGTNRYGTPTELGTEPQDLEITQDKAFTYTIDRRNWSDQQYVTEVGKSLARQTRQVMVPNTDSYRLAKLAAVAAGNLAVVDAEIATSAETAYSILLDAGVELDDKEVPDDGRIAYISSGFYKFLKLDNNFIKSGDLSQKTLIRGQIGEVDGVAIIKVPKGRMPANVDLILTRKKTLLSPKKIDSHKVHKDAPGINGWLVEGRRYYDAFVLKNKAAGIVIHTIPEPVS
jgi:N4-gp56 family major capsid protein